MRTLFKAADPRLAEEVVFAAIVGLVFNALVAQALVIGLMEYMSWNEAMIIAVGIQAGWLCISSTLAWMQYSKYPLHRDIGFALGALIAFV
jgi:hypothetical protein